MHTQKYITLFFLILGNFFFSYSNTKDSLILSIDEQEWLENNKDNIRYAPNPSWAPGDFIDDDGNHKGIISDYIKIVEDYLDIEFQRVYFKNWDEMYSGLLTNKVDFLGAIQKTEEREKFLSFTEPVINIPVVILVNKNKKIDFSDNDLKGMRIAAMKGYITQNYLQEDYTNYKLFEFEDELSALLQTSLGNTDGTIIDLMTSSYLIDKYGITNLSVGTELDFVWQLGFAFRKEHEMLAQITNKILANLSDDKKKEIFNKWVNINYITKQNFIQKYYKILLGSLVLLLLAILISVTYSSTLRKQVRKRTEQLNKELEAKNNAILQSKKNEARLESLFELSKIKTDKSAIFLDYALVEIIKLTESQFGLLYKYDKTKSKFILSNKYIPTNPKLSLMRESTTFNLSELYNCKHHISKDPSLQLNTCVECRLNKENRCPITNLKINHTLIFPIVDDDEIEALLYLAKETKYDKGDTQQIILLINAVWKLLSKQKWQEELIVAKAKAEESDRLKTAFLSNISHEIRTPMNGVVGFSDLLKDPNLSKSKQKEYINLIQNSTQNLLSVITDIVEISKIESGTIPTNINTFDLDNLIDNIYEESLIALGKNKNVTIQIAKKESSTPLITTDETKLKQIITNLISNAIKYTTKGSVTIDYQISKNNELEVRIKDTGVGIDKKYHKIIFERFRQGDKELAIEKGGMGLGLTITQSYVKMLGGEIELESDIGKGTVFIVTIPVKIFSSKKNKDIEEDYTFPIENLKTKILIAEDQNDNYLFLEEILTDYKFTIIHAKDGQETLALFNEHPDINLILLDIKMPKLNGYQVIKKIRRVNNQIPIIAQTAFALSEDNQKILKAGFSDYITKPIKKEKLLTMISKHLN